MKRRKFKISLRVLYFISFAIIAYFLWYGRSFYLSPYSSRPHHPQYRLLHPAGEIGHGLGIVGSAMMLFMLLYSLRKRVKLMRKWGRLSYWLDIHIYFGIIGPILVILHTSFKVQGLVAISFWSMIAVALSGVLGRYLYLQIPRNILGDELDPQQIMEEERNMEKQLQEVYHLSEEEIQSIDASLKLDRLEKAGLLHLLFLLIWEDIFRPLRLRRLNRKFTKTHRLPPSLLKQLLSVMRKKAVLHERLYLWNRVHQLFHYWHVFHKPFAIIMYLIMLVHVGIAVWMGYTWKF